MEVIFRLIILSILIYFQADENDFNAIRPLQQRPVIDGDTFQLVQNHCKIPYVPMYSKIFNKTTTRGLDPNLDKCDNFPDFTSLKNNILRLTDMSMESSCCVHEILRPQLLPTDQFIIDPICHKFEDGKLDVSKMEFMRVVCHGGKTGGTRKVNFLANVLTSGKNERKRQNWKLRSKRPMSIFVLIIDSTSRTEAYRELNKTIDILVNKLNFVDFKGHHPVAEPTMNNALALLMGMKGVDIWNHYKFSWREFWDSVPFIWDLFSQMDFITGYFEDLPMVGTFNYDGQRGFVHRPTDLTLRPIMLALNRQFPFNGQNFCFGHRSVIKFMFDYQFEAMQRFRDTPTFLVSWPVWSQHEVPHSLHTQDVYYAEFFENIAKERDILENTFFIVASDHAAFHGEYSFTQFGLLERRTAPLLIRVPERLQRQFPHAVDNLLWNSEIVTSHYDLYRTLLHLAYHLDETDIIKGQGFEKYGESLLQKLNKSRSCKEASILPTMCSCNLPKPKDDINAMFPNQTHNPELLIDSKQFPRFG